jgi:hypothetical protein
VAAVLGSVLVLSGIPAGSSAQDVATSLVGYDAAATGSAFTAFPRIPAVLPVDVPIEATLSLATATLSSGGQGFGRASSFYPGTLTAGLRPLLETGTGTRLPIPDYPVVVEAREFEEAKHADVPGITMHVDVDPARSVAVADTGALAVPAVVGTRSAHTESRAVLDAGGITATSTSTLNGIDIAGVVTIGSLVSVASVHSDGVTATCSGGVTIHDVFVSGTKATLDDTGLHVDGEAVVPGLGLGPLVADLLKASGIQVQLLGGADGCAGSLGSRTTAGLLISIPTPDLGIVTPGGLQVVLGSTSATAGGSGLPPDDLGTTDVPPSFGDVVSRLPGPFAGGSVLDPVASPGGGRGPTAVAIDPVSYTFDGVPGSLLAGLALLALAATGRVRRYMDRIIGLVT